jgi:hypothetical protein
MWGILHMLICYAQPFVLIQAPFIWVQLEMVSQTQITSNNPYFSIL